MSSMGRRTRCCSRFVPIPRPVLRRPHGAAPDFCSTTGGRCLLGVDLSLSKRSVHRDLQIMPPARGAGVGADVYNFPLRSSSNLGTSHLLRLDHRHLHWSSCCVVDQVHEGQPTGHFISSVNQSLRYHTLYPLLILSSKLVNVGWSFSTSSISLLYSSTSQKVQTTTKIIDKEK
jgi:hypothetical protein